MREILFRGRREDIGEWVYGYLNRHPSPVQIGYYNNPWTIHVPPRDPDDSGGVYNVSPATVGQYTGLTDKNGVKIFEGDVVHILGDDVGEWKGVDYNALIAFLDGGFCAIDGTVDEHALRRYALCRMDSSIEIIGNIHDNPELLEEES